MATETKIGKIESISLGYGGYQGAMFGLNVRLKGDGWNRQAFDEFWAWGRNMKPTGKSCKWTDEQFAKQMRRINQAILDAKVHALDELKDKPVEATFDGFELVSWRILTEAI